MPKKKITLEEAFEVFEAHGLEVEVRGIQKAEPTPLSAFLETTETTTPSDIPHKQGKMIRVNLYTKHTVSNGGQMHVENGQQQVVNNETLSYGPGVVTVPEDIAAYLLHQDRAAQQAEERMLDGKFRTYAIIPIATQQGVVNAGVQVSEDRGFDLSSFLGRLGDNQIHLIR